MTDHSAQSVPHVLPLKVYLGVGAALLFLTAVTISVSFVPLGAWNMVVALTIASTKALLVAFFFMHLYYDNKFYFLMFTVGVFLLTLFIVLCMFDTMQRGAIYDIKSRPINPNAAMYSQPRPGEHGEAGAAKDSAGSKSDSTARSQTPGK